MSETKEKLTKLLGREPTVGHTPDGRYLVAYMNWNIAKDPTAANACKGDTEDEAMQKLIDYLEKKNVS